MDTGVVAEFDNPYKLLQNKNGIFHKMVEALGSQEYDRLLNVAKETFEQSEDKKKIQ